MATNTENPKKKIKTDSGDKKPQKNKKNGVMKTGSKNQKDTKPPKFMENKSVKLQKHEKLSNKREKGGKPQSITNQLNLPEGEKPNWAELKKTKKALKEKRKESELDKMYSIFLKAKKIGEKLRLMKIKDEERQALTTELHQLLKGHYKEAIFSHDMSRIFQWILKKSDPEIREEAFLELEEVWVKMLEQKYSSKCIQTAIKVVADSTKAKIVDACLGHVVKLTTNVYASPTFEKIYSDCANEKQKNLLKQEFYGDLYKQDKIKDVKTIADVYKNAATMKVATFSAVKANVNKVLNKELLGSSLVHVVLKEFFLECSNDERAEMIEALKSSILQLSETKNGSEVAIMCVWHGTAKDRKVIMKSLKGHLKDVYVSEYGHQILIALIDCVDDTVVLKKFLLSEVENDLLEIASNEFGKRVVLHIFARRNTKFFHPRFIEFLQKGDGNSSSKKPADVREKELVDSLVPKFLSSIKTDLQGWLQNGPMQMLTLAILSSNHEEDLTELFQTMALYLVNPESKIEEGDKSFDAIEHSGMSFVLKKILKMDQQFREKNKSSLGEAIVQVLEKDVIKKWVLLNRGCFLLVFILENAREEVVQELKIKLQFVKGILGKGGNRGAEILLKKI